MLCVILCVVASICCVIHVPGGQGLLPVVSPSSPPVSCHLVICVIVSVVASICCVIHVPGGRVCHPFVSPVVAICVLSPVVSYRCTVPTAGVSPGVSPGVSSVADCPIDCASPDGQVEVMVRKLLQLAAAGAAGRD